ncbi:hypothetical protein [Citricoccus sp. NR2]|uniref:hypothetical protein n=1 Tax=Citricoccus sp. NR2 TaxID=3004095 RepID=UPI0022DDE4F3|nr:hypothetical protein [Citricoccus sp. NR2]WBL18816.1 hypothetical protein O1A05_13825 [Citricoccus sp. NR2]
MKGGGGGGGCFGIIVALVLIGLVVQYWYIVVGLIVIGLAIWGLVTWGAASSENDSRRYAWHKLDQRFTALCTHIERHESDPQRALTTPGWLDESNPLVRSYATAVAQAQHQREQLIADGGGPRRNSTSSAPNRVSTAQLRDFRLIVNQLAASFEEIDQALRLTGWAHHDHAAAPHPQFLLDQRWGQPALLPSRVILDGAHGHDNVRRFIEESYPITRADALDALSSRGTGRLPGGRSLPTLLAEHATEDADGFLWPHWVDVASWGVHRTFGPDADLSVHQASPVELANAIWVMLGEASMTEQEIAAGLLEHLDLTGFPDGVPPTERFAESLSRRTAQWDRLVASAVHTGMLTERLQRRLDGRLGRGRSSWPGTYRNNAS